MIVISVRKFQKIHVFFFSTNATIIHMRQRSMIDFRPQHENKHLTWSHEVKTFNVVIFNAISDETKGKAGAPPVSCTKPTSHADKQNKSMLDSNLKHRHLVDYTGNALFVFMFSTNTIVSREAKNYHIT